MEGEVVQQRSKFGVIFMIFLVTLLAGGFSYWFFIVLSGDTRELLIYAVLFFSAFGFVFRQMKKAYENERY